MWTDLPVADKTEYKRMILSFASLTEMFAQKSDDSVPIPIVNSKYQETVFQRVFRAVAEDIGNTSYDASLVIERENGETRKYLIGIKTFGYNSGEQKVAQFKANLPEWSELIGQITANAVNNNGTRKSRDEINYANQDLYKELACKIATLRNMRIDSSEAGLQGFTVTVKRDNIETVYHYLMPAKQDDKPVIYVGETSYDRIRIDDIQIIGCTSPKNPANFDFTDGNHKYRYTAADSQLLMDFDNRNTAIEEWSVIYAEDAYEIFSEIGNRIFGEQQTALTQDYIVSTVLAKKKLKTESYSWLIENKNGEVEQFSGFNGFYGTGSKLGRDTRLQRINSLNETYISKFSENDLRKRAFSAIISLLKSYLLDDSLSREEKIQLRKEMLMFSEGLNEQELTADLSKLIFRPQSEMYIPLPNSVQFHNAHPDFFGKGLGVLKKQGSVSKLVNKGHFTLVFEPSGDSCEAFITQDGGKAIESCEKQSILGEWVLRKVFQLAPYEPLTAKRLYEIGLNGIRIWKEQDSDSIHIQFVWIDKDNLPDDFII